MWQVWWADESQDIAEQVDEFPERNMAEAMAAAIFVARGGLVALIHVENAGTEFEYATYWVMNATGNGWKMVAMSPSQGKHRNHRGSRPQFPVQFTPGAIEL